MDDLLLQDVHWKGSKEKKKQGVEEEGEEDQGYQKGAMADVIGNFTGSARSAWPAPQGDHRG